MNDLVDNATDSKKHSRIRGFLGCLGLIVLPGLAYYGAATGLGFRGNPTISAGILIAGAVITYVLFGVVMTMGESIIEDVVKFILFSMACAIAWNKGEPHIQALLLAIPIGSGLPLLIRLISRPRENRRAS